MAARLRPARTSNSPRCFARARHRNTARGSACRRGRAICREASPGQDPHSRGLRPATPAINREHGHFPVATLRCAPFRRPEKWPTSLVKPNWSDTPCWAPRAAAGLPMHPSPASLPLRSIGGESEQMASHWRDSPNPRRDRLRPIRSGYDALPARLGHGSQTVASDRSARAAEHRRKNRRPGKMNTGYAALLA